MLTSEKNSLEFIGGKNIPEIPMESYFKQLIYYLYHYLDIIRYNPNNDVKIGLNWVIFPNNESKRDYDKIKYSINNETAFTIYKYTSCIMTLLGKIAECVVIDHCNNNTNTNMICINIAKFNPYIYYQYDITYNEYMAFSPSYKFVFAYDLDGFFVRYPVPDYNPNHTSKDIAWCKRDNIVEQLKAEIPEVLYLENAKLQIKTTLNCGNLDLSSPTYITTPIICFDLNYDINNLKLRYPHNIIYSARQIDQQMFEEIVMYFRILGAYATGIIDRIDIPEKDIVKNDRLMQLFRTPIEYLSSKEREMLDTSGVIELLNQYKKPVVVNT